MGKGPATGEMGAARALVQGEVIRFFAGRRGERVAIDDDGRLPVVEGSLDGDS